MPQSYDIPVDRSTDRADDDLYRSLFERSGLGIARLDADRRVVEANADLLNYSGRSLHDVRGREFADLIHPDVRAGLERQMVKLVEGRRGRFTERVPVVLPDGTAVPTAMTAIAVRGDAASTTALLVIMRHAASPRAAGEQERVLTDVHARILEGMAAGLSTSQLASQLYLSRQGVEYHLSAMLRKLKAPNRIALISRAYTMGVLTVTSWPPRVDPAFVR
ncbi:PAS domain-containing protein [Actinokineospora sp. G85]|uniref:PAS domain-containing protein n=1 Tax=Actinokineospora sp. G85 TaxID=3406626 RepID=UPI003C765755